MEVDTSKLWDVPSVFKQGLEGALFNFGKAHNSKCDYFNCGLVRRDDGLWLITRRAQWIPQDKMGLNDLVAFSISEPIMKLHAGFPIHMGKQWPIEHFEDARAYYVSGRTFISACNFVRNSRGCCYPHQVICEVAKDWSLIKRYDPVYGNNGNDTAKNLAHEKNWNFCFDLGVPILIYKASPHTVVKFDWDFRPQLYLGKPVEWITEWDSSVWPYGEIRGGTPPVLHEGEFWTFFHSSTKFRTHKRQYHLGAYAFEFGPPFRITKITTEPLLSGSVEDRWDIDKPPCIFTQGSEIQDGQWLITSGVNDIQCCWHKIPHAELKDRMIDIL